MSALIRFEFRKLFQAKVLYVCAAVMVGLILLFAGVNKLTEMAVESITDDFYMEEEFAEPLPEGELPEYYDDFGIPEEGYPDDYSFEDSLDDSFSQSMGLITNNNGLTGMMSALSNIYIVVAFAAFAAVFICGDFGNGTIKNVLTKGYSRGEVYFAKYIVCMVTSIVYALIAFLAGFLTGTLMWNIGEGWSIKVLPMMLIQLLVMASYSTFFCFLAALFKRTGPVLVTSIAFPIVLPMILTLIELIINKRDVLISDYWLNGAFSLVSSTSTDAKEIITAVAVAVVYGIIFTICGWLLSRRREV